ncbi:MAG: type III PLP-dependent enzyme [Alphaproteobacteria bacterium]|nr:type III PLP-dependent enzyme [Alphaproteobacteria bacterium]
MEQEPEQGHAKVHYLNFTNNESALSTVEKEVFTLKPSIPVYFLRPAALKRAADFFLKNFRTNKHQSDVLYSVKSNPDVAVLRHLFNAGIKHFDVASLAEIHLIKELFGEEASMYFMHPIKSREAIFEAYYKHGIRDFSLDSFDELKKILEVTNNARDLGLHVRLAISNSHSAIDLSRKFGILPSKAIALVRKTRMAAKRFGICFHVGSQCMDPAQYRGAIMIAKDLAEKAKVKIDVLDIGGGFPSLYPNMSAPNLSTYFAEIFDAISQINLDSECRIWCEPGRALVAEAGSLLVRVEGRKNNMLYLNDGTYGGLFDAGTPNFIYPTRVIRIKGRTPLAANGTSFGFYGPTCDSLDVMKGPFYLPENIFEGDYIEIGQLGAYSRSIRTEFNGFNKYLQIEVTDEPLASMYVESEEQRETELISSS